jgi:cytochrome c peroxidase
MNRGRLHFLLYGFLTLLATVLVVKLILPRDEAIPAPDASNAPDNSSLLRGMRGQQSAIRPIPALTAAELKSGKVLLGEKLFNDPQLSADGTISCASCHFLKSGGSDGRPVSIGMGGAKGDYNAPTVFNSVFNFRQFWDGRAADLVEQISGPLTSPVEMASSWVIAVRRVNENPAYRQAFREEYDNEINERTIADALARYETTLITPDAPFDRYLGGDDRAISADALEGYRRFSDYGCISCHQGINIGANFFQRFGVMGDYFADRGNVTKSDLGRYNVTGQDEDRYVFKVPSLRNVALTAPYFHDGSTANLDQAVEIMGRYQLGRTLTEEDRRYIVAFLESLTGEFRGERLQP